MRDGRETLRSLVGCGCMAVTALAALAAAVVMVVWRPPSDQRPSATPWLAGWETERARTLDALRRERNAAVAGGERTVKSGTLAADRDVSLRCDDVLTVLVEAGTFGGPQPVEIKAFAVGKGFLPPAVEALAAYDVKIGPGGPLRRPVVLSFTHAPLPQDAALKAVRWDESTAGWVPLRLTRRSPTTTLVHTDHLTRVAVTKAVWSAYERHHFEGSGVEVAIRADFAPDVERLFARAADGPALARIADEEARRREERRLESTRFEEAADSRGFSDTRRSERERYDGAVRRRVLAAVIHAMAERIRRGPYSGGLPERYDIYVGDYEGPQWWQGWWVWEGVYLPMHEGMDSPEDLATTLGHELFHACQYQGGMGELWMGYSQWLIEATAEYAGARLAWGDLAARPFDEFGVRLDPVLLQSQMGEGLTPSFLGEPLTSISSSIERAYRSAHFLEFLFRRTPRQGLPVLWAGMKSAGAGDRNESVLAGYCSKAGVSLDDVYRDFAASVLLDAGSPAAPVAGPAPGSEFAPVTFDAPAATWSGMLTLPAAYTGEHVSFAVGPTAGEPGRRALLLTLTGSGSATVELYRTGKGRVDLAGSPPWRRIAFLAQPVVVSATLRRDELLHVVATRGGSGGDPRLALQAQLVELAIRAWRLRGTIFRFEVTTPPQLDGHVEYRWDFGDGTGEARTASSRVDHTWTRPGEYQVRVVLREHLGGVAGEATTRVTVPAPPATPAPTPRPTRTPQPPRVTPPPPVEPLPPPARPKPPSPTPPERRYDEAAALAAFTADFEARYQGSERSGGKTIEYRLEWATRPFISKGAVLANYRVLRENRLDDGTRSGWYEENSARSEPFELTTVSKLQDKYPQFWR